MLLMKMVQTIFLVLKKDESLVDSLGGGLGSSKPPREVGNPTSILLAHSFGFIDLLVHEVNVQLDLPLRPLLPHLELHPGRGSQIERKSSTLAPKQQRNMSKGETKSEEEMPAEPESGSPSRESSISNSSSQESQVIVKLPPRPHRVVSSHLKV